MSRLIIDYPDDMSADDALVYARQHCCGGKVSMAAEVPHFCWVSQFYFPPTIVYTRRKKVGQTSDSLLICREKQDEPISSES